ncbi:MAG TPA: amidase, partial [Acidimicrobiales bacterium]|nr:amidase [Acidimicrobiales bacterium]
MTDTPWQGDACALVDAFRSGERTPEEEVELVLAAIERSTLHALCHVDAEGARAAAAGAEVSQPLGGVPIGVKELEPVEGWPQAEGSLVFADRVADHTTTMVRRLEGAGVVKVGQTTASEFGGLNVSVTKLHGVTHNPWQAGRTAGGSSGGSAAAVAGGLLPIATGSDGGGSIRIPAGFCGLVGLKGTAGRIPRGPLTEIAPLTVVVGCVARSVRDVARWFDVCSGYDARDPYSLPRIDGWERDLGTHSLAGLRIAIVPDLGNAVVRPEVDAAVREAGEALARDAG